MEIASTARRLSVAAELLALASATGQEYMCSTCSGHKFKLRECEAKSERLSYFREEVSATLG